MTSADDRLARQTGGFQAPDERALDLAEQGVTLAHLNLRTVGGGGKADVDEAVLSAELERTIAGASTLTVDLHDPDRKLLDSDLFSRAVDVLVGGTWYRLASVSKSGPTITLVFEDRVVAYLRSHNKPRKASRKSTTRAQFARSLVREVTVERIPFVSPEVNVRQAIGKAKDAPSKAAKDAKREGGFADDVKLDVKGKRATRAQLRLLETVLDTCASVKAGAKITLAAIEVVIVEKRAGAEPGNDADSIGPFQQRNMAPWNKRDRGDAAASTRTFIEVARSVSKASMSADEVAWRVQQPKESLRGEYGKRRKEAEAIIAAYGGAAGGGSYQRRYEFTRGTAGQRENSWTALQRLAAEVRWRCFVDGGTVYFLDDAQLLGSRPRATLTENDDAVDAIDYRVTPGASKGPASATVTVRAGRYAIAPGTVVTVTDSGPADGRWLVESIRRSLFDTSAELGLRRPQPELPEPASETVDRDTSGSGSRRAKIVAAARASMSTRTHHHYYRAGGVQNAAHLADPTPQAPYRSDCSQWVHAVYRKAGAPSPGLTTYAQAAKGKRTTRPKPGDLMLTGDRSHVELYVGDGKTIGHGSEPIDAGPPLSYWASKGGHYFVTFPFLDE